MRRFSWGLCVGVVSLFAACGGKVDSLGDDGGAPDAAPDHKLAQLDAGQVDAAYQPLGKKCSPPTGAAPPVWTPTGTAPAQHPPIMQSSGGPTLTNPQLVAMTFDGDDLRDQIEDFMDSVGCTTYWRSFLQDYGINDAYALPPVHMSDKAPASIDDSQIGLFIRQKILTKAVPDDVAGSTLYVIFYPDTTDITLQGEHSCSSFGGYHNEVSLPDGRHVAYAVIPRCGGFGGLGEIDELTATTSHELAEAVTDPNPMTNPAYQFPEGNGVAWALGGGGEIGDLCEMNDDAFYLPNDYPFYVQRQWTSHSAYAGHDPCQPSTSTYFAAAPVLTDTIPFDFGFGAETTIGLKLAVNASTTIDLNLIADAPWNNPITVTVHDASHFLGGNTSLNFSLQTTQGNVGDTLKLQVTRIGTNQQIGLEPFVVRAQSAGLTRSWWGVVGDP